ncbi:MAG: hypothetical protein ACSHW7_15605 [Patiriisocius sp.]|uniref:hypothetical protein n=1 Tax=Patiriisocius sp. TaxID=2822396 RepID=UPI003EF806B0
MKTKYLNTEFNLKINKGLSLLFFFLFVCNIGFSQNCNSDLSVEKNRNFKSVPENGVLYVLELKNNSRASQTYIIEFLDVTQSCANERKASKQPNVPLNVKIIDNWAKRSKLSNTITVSSGQKKTFNVLVEVPKGTPVDRWGCVKVQATNPKCDSSKLTTILSAYISDPSER